MVKKRFKGYWFGLPFNKKNIFLCTKEKKRSCEQSGHCHIMLIKRNNMLAAKMAIDNCSWFEANLDEVCYNVVFIKAESEKVAIGNTQIKVEVNKNKNIDVNNKEEVKINRLGKFGRKVQNEKNRKGSLLSDPEKE